MNVTELDSFKLSDAVKFHNRLNPKIWGRDEHLLPEVREKLLAIADNFREFLGVGDLDVKDITISGSNAAYNYTPYSDIDLHLVVAFPANDEIYQELFNAKKYQYNDEHNLAIGGVPVELYVQNADEPPVSQGEYSVTRNEWIQVPRRKRAQVDDTCVRAKVEDLDARIHSAIQSGNADSMGRLWDKIKAMRKSGLDEHGEFGCENIVFKILRNKGCIKELRSARTAAQDRELSLKEQNRPQERKVWGFGEGSLADMRAAFARDAQPTAPSKVYRSPEEYVKAKQLGPEELKKLQRIPASYTPVSVREQDQPNTVSLRKIIEEFFGHVVEELGIKNLPKLRLRRDPAWTRRTGSFGQYNPESNELDLATSGRHVLDILRTMAHELTHCKQGERGDFPDWAGETGSPWEDEANAMAGRIMRGMAERHPEYFADIELTESSGYIPTKAQAKDPRFEMALSVDVHPGQTGREANKMSLETDAQGHPQVLRADGRVKLAESLAQELKLFEEQDLFEINMGSKNLRKEAAKTGAIAGMEFEMIVPGIKSEDPEQEPDYESDQRCRSIEDAVQFFHDGDYNGRRDVERLRGRMLDDYLEWRDEKLRNDWDNEGEDYIRDWIANNVDDSEWKDAVDDDTTEQDAFDEFAINVHADPSNDYYNQAFEEFMEEFADNYDESDWLDEEDLDLMSAIENAYEITWPYWTDMNSGEIDADEVADEFGQAVGKEVRVNTRYHQSGDRPGPNNQFYVVEPDGSLEGDNPGDEGLEFVSPPMPIDELLKDLNAVKAWAGRMGVYTNSSTGLHINISVPDYSLDRLDYVKLALLLGDEYVLKQFGRASNTYTKSALGKVRDRVRSNPEDAQRLLDKMKGQMGELASKAIHSGITDKYTSINTKSGHIEFRSPGGDWLDDNFDKIENTLLRFTVAMSAALNPEAYKEEYQKKLYKLLTADQKDSDTIRYFSDYVAGKIPQAALRSFVKQAQLERKLKRGEAGNQPMWWSVSNPPHSHASIEVVASSKEEAIAKALGQDGYPSWANTRQSVVAKPLRPYVEKPQSNINQPSQTDYENRLGWPDQTGDANYEIIDRRTGRRQMVFIANTDQDAQRKYTQWLDVVMLPHDTEDYGYRAIVVPGSTIDLQRQRAAQAQQIPEVPLDIEVNYPQASSAPAGNSFSGQWKVLVNGEEVWRFRGIGNSQADANRLAAQWLRDNGRGVSGEGYEVVPVMVEGRTREDYDPNGPPPGPETKPTMPRGTVRVDVSDVYDWYKLGTNISNLDQADPKMFGKGPPSTIVSFGDENIEHKYINALKKLGLGTTDIDPVDPNQPAGMPRQKTDPTYNVNETDASDYELHDRPKLDRVLAQCCRMVVKGQQRDPERYGQVAACVIDPDNRMIYGINLPGKDGTRRHAERVAIDKYRKNIGEIPEGSIIVTTCSPCNSPMEERSGESCKDLLNSVGIHKVYAGYQDPTQHDDSDADFRVYVTENDQLWSECQLFAQTFLGAEELPENFADGRHPEDKGDSKRYGVPTKASVSTLRKVAKQGGRKGQLSHWMANMKAGRAKAKHNK